MNQNDAHKYRLALVALTLSILAYAGVPLLVRWCETDVSPEAALFNRLWIAAFVLLCWKIGQNINRVRVIRFSVNSDLPVTQQAKGLLPSFNIDRKSFFLLMIVATSFVANVWALYWGMRKTSIVNSSLIHNLTPLFATFGGWLLFKTQFSRRFILGTAIATIGAIVLGFNDFQFDSTKIQGDAVALCSALFLTINLLSIECLRGQFSTSFILLLECAIGLFLSGLLTLMWHEPLFPATVQGWLSVIGLAILGHLMGGGLQTYALSYLSAGFVALMCLLDPMLTGIAAWFAFGETLSLANVLAFVIILLGTCLAISVGTTKQVEADAGLKLER
ncbi:MAG: DMT family transporter [Symploca sp. SIO1B1]|nr:DMT family transporter [Symploca sp. SIO1B1]